MAPYDQFLLFGDSLTQQSSSQDRGFAFAPALQNAYIRRLDIINRGFSGYTSTLALDVLPEIVPSPEQAKLRFMTVFLGANDSCLPGSVSKQHVPLAQYRANLFATLTHPAVERQNPRLILITPPPVDEFALERDDAQYGITEPRRTAEHTRLYADAAREVGRELNVAVLDLWTTMVKAAGWQEGQPLPGSKAAGQNLFLQGHLRDGLHFSPKAYELLFQEVLKTIRESWPDQTPESLPFVHPPYQTLL